ncbi:MAG: ribosomal-processing cysteine protease Prp [Eubacteriales bacterium]|nr:ribosomal-processing cysteine protease Prp [Eubacteriales bacterium]
MIEISITAQGIRMQGHAGKSINGQDIVCAAVSALTCNLINSLQELTDNRIRADTSSGLTIIEWEELSEPGKLLVDSWFLGLTAVNQEHNCIKFI